MEGKLPLLLICFRVYHYRRWGNKKGYGSEFPPVEILVPAAEGDKSEVYACRMQKKAFKM
jgi:hypothetical protein